LQIRQQEVQIKAKKVDGDLALGQAKLQLDASQKQPTGSDPQVQQAMDAMQNLHKVQQEHAFNQQKRTHADQQQTIARGQALHGASHKQQLHEQAVAHKQQMHEQNLKLREQQAKNPKKGDSGK